MFINNKYIGFKSILKTKENTGIYLLILLLDYLDMWVPRFCYHSKLSTSGNCRMCLVELVGTLKPVVSCCLLMTDSMVIYTNTEVIRRSREYIMEFLLINHPLDCPICDQAGECDLQDLSLIYGSNDSRFEYDKKSILNKQLDPLIQTNMNRCIYCTRCVRYTSEINNTFVFNTLGRGIYSEIGNYNQDVFQSNYINGNVIDLCPVGALTAKPYAFRNRNWEVTQNESIDILDSVCSNIRIDTKNNVVERILPKPNDNLNEEWITDKIRFCYDGFKKQRITLPFYKTNYNNILVYVLCSWYFIFNKIKLYYNISYNLYQSKTFFSVYTGHLVDLFTLNTLKDLCKSIGVTNLNLNLNLNLDLRKYYIFNNNLKTLELNNVFLILGTNPKIDTPILNIKIRSIKYKFNNKIKVFYIGSRIIINYNLIHLGISSDFLLDVLYGKSFICKILKNIYNIICLFSIGFNYIINSTLPLTLDYLSFVLKKQHFLYSYISLFASDVSIYELGITSYYYSKSIYIKNNNTKLIYLLGVDFNNLKLQQYKYSIYQGHNGDTGILNTNIILPSNNYIENSCYYLNCEGRFFFTNLITNKKNKANNNETILFNLFTYLCTRATVSKLNIFILFFYKNSFFFSKYKYVVKCNIINKKTMLFYSNILFTVVNNFFSMDVFSKTSFYIKKLLQQEEQSTSFNIF